MARRASARRAGRPARGEELERREHLLAAALDVFLRQGFSGTSLDAIAQEAHVAKRTIYQQFGSKEGLFGAAIERSATRLISRFPAVDHTSGELGADLTSIGCAVLDLVLQPRSLAIYRLVAGEAERQPRLAQVFYQHGPGRAITRVAERLASHMRQGRITQIDSVALARQFIGLVVLEIHQRAMLGMQPSLSEKEIETHVAAATRSFVSALQAMPRPLESTSLAQPQPRSLVDWIGGKQGTAAPPAPTRSRSETTKRVFRRRFLKHQTRRPSP